ncbi:hypothetical protein CDG76_19220 [Nostoc sp. 'Peltigera membranacea cyanobiont' 210A]|nr:hypothetical protein CDG76_19220 [Nostoc sp. 'Peltigera membranacea cyanobiont' 210A]
MILSTSRSPLAPLKKGGTRIKVPLFKGDLGGSIYNVLLQARGLFKHPFRPKNSEFKVKSMVFNLFFDANLNI